VRSRSGVGSKVRPPRPRHRQRDGRARSRRVRWRWPRCRARAGRTAALRSRRRHRRRVGSQPASRRILRLDRPVLSACVPTCATSTPPSAAPTSGRRASPRSSTCSLPASSGAPARNGSTSAEAPVTPVGGQVAASRRAAYSGWPSGRSAQQHPGCRAHGVRITQRSTTQPHSAHAIAMGGASAAAEPGPIQHSSPPRARRCPARRTLDRPHPPVEPTEAAEANADLGVRAQPNHAGAHSLIAATPTAPAQRLDEVATDSSSHHHASLKRLDRHVPDAPNAHYRTPR
jgi:hypothetical protein